MTIFDYVAYSNPSGANNVLQYYGLRPSRDPRETSKMLAFCVTKRGQEALDLITKVHPDYRLIESMVESNKPSQTDKFSNACGCSSQNNGFSNANGGSQNPIFKSVDKSELFITGGLVLIGLAMVLKLMK